MAQSDCDKVTLTDVIAAICQIEQSHYTLRPDDIVYILTSSTCYHVMHNILSAIWLLAPIVRDAIVCDC